MVNYNGFNHEKILEVYLIKLLRIDSKKTVQILFRNKHGEAQLKSVIKKSVQNII